MAIGARRFWRDVSLNEASKPSTKTAISATQSVLTLQYLDGNNNAAEAEGCTNGDDQPTQWRRRFHHATFYGFMLCFASTSVATLYHYFLGLKAPYALSSLPVILGTLGGIGLLVGTAGLAWLEVKRHAPREMNQGAMPIQGAASQRPMDRGFVALLFLTSLTGLALLAWRNYAAMPLLLAIHLGVVMALFLTLPYGKMMHGVYRGAALLKWAGERDKEATHS
jgi:citrate/tricarballylate utilization protein